MKTAALPANEAERLATLREYEILDTAAEQIFDRITQLAARVCEVPIALISLIDERRQWFKSAHGLPGVTETSRDIAFCSHAILSHDVMEVPDATLDPRFRHNPLVVADPAIRFYAGAPLRLAGGPALGTLCVIDREPKLLSTDQRETLSHLSETVMALLDARRAMSRMARLGVVLDNSFDEIYVFGKQDLRFLYANRGAQRNLQYSTEELSRLTPLDLKPALRRADFAALLSSLDSGAKDQATFETRHRRKDGSSYPVEVRLQVSRYEEAPAYVAIVNDISARRQVEEALFRQRELAQVTLSSIADAVITTDACGAVSYLNPAAEQLTGWTDAQARGFPVERVLHIVHEEDGTAVQCPVARVLESGAESGIEDNIVLLSRTGERFMIEDSAAPIRGSDGACVGAVLVFHDVTARRKLTSQLTHQATHDQLTGLANRRKFESTAEKLLDRARTTRKEHVLLYLDLDRFKLVNDTCGHAAGDELLRQLATLLSSKVRRSDTLARLGGDEFGALLEGCPMDEGLRVAQNLVNAVNRFRFSWNDRVFSVGVSVGLAVIDEYAEDLKSILSGADTACFMAKEKGRGRVQLYRQDDAEVRSRRGEMDWLTRITEALDADRFSLHYQRIEPIAAAPNANASAEHWELLLRMRDEAGYEIPPMAFIPAAERYNLMATLDRWVIRNAFASLAPRLRRMAPARAAHCRYAINLSGASINDEDLLDYIVTELEASAMPPEAVCFEITETAAITHLSRAMRLIEHLRVRGCRFALDDFGSGLSSFNYLKSLPVDYLKIDGGFVKGIAEDPVDLAMVEAINRIGRVMGIATIAEWVESEACLVKLREIGVGHVQGYHIHRPQPLGEWTAHVRAPHVHTRGTPAAEVVEQAAA